MNPADMPSLLAYNQAASQVQNDLALENQLYQTNSQIDPSLQDPNDPLNGNTYSSTSTNTTQDNTYLAEDSALSNNTNMADESNILDYNVSNPGVTNNANNNAMGGLIDVVSNAAANANAIPTTPDSATTDDTQKRLRTMVNTLNTI